jgi:hypothetical protein
MKPAHRIYSQSYVDRSLSSVGGCPWLECTGCLQLSKLEKVAEFQGFLLSAVAVRLSWSKIRGRDSCTSFQHEQPLCNTVFPSNIIAIIGTTSHRRSWPPSEASSILLDSWLLPTNSLIAASLRPFPHHLSTWHAVFPLFLVLPIAHMVYVSLLGIQFLSILAIWPAYRSLAILITTECPGSLKTS